MINKIESFKQINISQDEFILFKEYIYNHIGISLSDQKITLLRTRLNKRLRELNFKSFNEYYIYLEKTPTEHTALVSAISTNVTYFFREENHWSFLTKHINKIIQKNKKLRVWSSACSTGEEPYSMGMFLKEHYPSIDEYDIKILATDISHEAIKKAQVAQYNTEQVCTLSKNHIDNYFNSLSNSTHFGLSDEVKKLVMFRTFNLVYGNYNLFKHINFNLIFCRNVLIYFDEETKQKVADNLTNQLQKGGYLFIGHSESLRSHKQLKYIAPSIYQKI